MGKLRPAGQIRPASPFILDRRHLHKLKLPPRIERKTFFPLEIMDGSDFQKNKPQRRKIGIKNEKNEVKTSYFGDHIRTWTVISKKKIFCFPTSVRPAVSTVFPNLVLRVKSLPTPDLAVSDFFPDFWFRP